MWFMLETWLMFFIDYENGDLCVVIREWEMRAQFFFLPVILPGIGIFPFFFIPDSCVQSQIYYLFNWLRKKYQENEEYNSLCDSEQVMMMSENHSF